MSDNIFFYETLNGVHVVVCSSLDPCAAGVAKFMCLRVSITKSPFHIRIAVYNCVTFLVISSPYLIGIRGSK